MKGAWLMLGVASALSLSMAELSQADTVELRTGQRVEGTFKEATSAGVVIEVGGQTITFKPERVRAIYFGAIPATPTAHSSKAAEALQALKGLQSATNAGIGYRDYAPRVLDAKIIVDRYLDGPEREGGEARQAIRAAIHYYVLAANAWNTKLVRGALPNAVGLDPAVNECAPARQLIEEFRRTEPDWERSDKVLGAGYKAGATIAFFGLPALWTCASNKLAEAERIITGTSGSTPAGSAGAGHDYPADVKRQPESTPSDAKASGGGAGSACPFGMYRKSGVGCVKIGE